MSMPGYLDEDFFQEDLRDFTEFQEDPFFPPDKASTWFGWNKEEDRFFLSIQSLRGEYEELEKCMAALPDLSYTGQKEDRRYRYEDWQEDCLKAAWNYHSEHVKRHTNWIETVLLPFLETRVKCPDSLKKNIEDVDRDLWNLDRNVGNRRFARGFDGSYKHNLFLQLEMEEDIFIPWIQAYFTSEEFEEIVETMSEMDGHFGSLVYYTGEERFRKEIRVILGIPLSAWLDTYKGALKEYQEEVIENVAALQEGKAPENKKCTRSDFTLVGGTCWIR